MAGSAHHFNTTYGNSTTLVKKNAAANIMNSNTRAFLQKQRRCIVFKTRYGFCARQGTCVTPPPPPQQHAVATAVPLLPLAEGTQAQSTAALFLHCTAHSVHCTQHWCDTVLQAFVHVSTYFSSSRFANLDKCNSGLLTFNKANTTRPAANTTLAVSVRVKYAYSNQHTLATGIERAVAAL